MTRNGSLVITDTLPGGPHRVMAVDLGFGSVFTTHFVGAGLETRPYGQPETYTDLLAFDAKKFVEYRRKLIDRGIFMMPANLKRAHLSYAHTDADVDRLLEATEGILKEF